ncbi:hypothetical protein [Chromohalobacter israelensis]|uniref:hypothetical protein n=1 Tax=Chromohalobacter israelensis TaxID=141390 RepID=UPI000557C041|nr:MULTISPECIES: hypothetical protein [Chromohalobacter]MBZ5876666.1 hypothetical protein [Chromohalobacter salexigens]MDF9435601.1 hypothetical protein [Chromohalobacter israelensis]
MTTDSVPARLRFLARVARKESRHLQETTERLFQSKEPLTGLEVQRWIADSLIAERMDAFVARFSRLQDLLGDKLIPSLLEHLGESSGLAIDNLDKAERFGWIASSDEWVVYRKLRNQMIHEYIEDPAVLADALDAGCGFVDALTTSAETLASEVERRLGPVE